MDWIRELVQNWGLYIVMFLKAFIVVMFGMNVAVILTWADRRQGAMIQDRVGPNRAGPFGLFQVVADMIKIFFKEDWIPPFADKAVFVMAPAIVLAAVLDVLWWVPAHQESQATGRGYTPVGRCHQVQELKRELPQLKRFVTLSPVPGFARWLDAVRGDPGSIPDRESRDTLALLDQPGWPQDADKAERLREAIMPLAARYLLEEKDRRGRPADPKRRSCRHPVRSRTGRRRGSIRRYVNSGSDPEGSLLLQ